MYLRTRPVLSLFIAIFIGFGIYAVWHAIAAQTVISTGYCLNGTMADGQHTHDGAVAMNGVAFGTKYRILNGTLAGKVVTVEDRHAPGSTDFDIWMSSCQAAINYGHQTIRIELYSATSQPPPARDLPAVYRSGWFYLRLFQNTGPANLSIPFGNAGDKGLMCDWDRNGSRTPGVFRDGTWYLRNYLSAGPANTVLGFGNTGDKPLCGDWDGNGFESVGVHRGNTFYLRNNNTTGGAEIAFPFGNDGDIPLACDWDGNGFTSIGVFRAGWFYLRNFNSAGPASYAFPYGNAGDTPVCGDWDANGTETIGVYRNGTFYLRNSNSAGPANTVFSFGNTGDKPLAWH